MAVDQLICGMWGTTNLRLYLVENGEVADVREGPGASKLLQPEFATTLTDASRDWIGGSSGRDIILGGMVGSTIGWADTSYMACPYNLVEQPALSRVEHRQGSVQIVHGLSTTNIFGEPDVMRGEEVELIGLFELFPEVRTGAHVVCIPGTHAKWVLLRDGVVENFFTSVAGELFAGLVRNGILVSSSLTPRNEISKAFQLGVDHSRDRQESLLHSLFSVRARQVFGNCQDSVHDAVDRLSGLVIGSDVATVWSHPDYAAAGRDVFVIGSRQVGERYACALEANNRSARLITSQEVSVAGFWSISERQRNAAVHPMESGIAK